MSWMAVLFGIAANADNFGIGVGYAVKRRHIPLSHNLLIAAATTLMTLGAFAVGGYLRTYLPERTPDTIGGSLFLVFALWNTLFDVDEPSTPSVTYGETVMLRESLFLAGNLSINNIALAFAGGLGALAYGSLAISVFIFSLLMLSAGQHCGRRFARSLPWLTRGPLFGNLILVGVGVLMLMGV